MNYVLKQIIKCVALLFVVSLGVFALVSLSPIDPVQANIGQSAYASMSAEKRAALAAYWGADTPFWERYITWLSSAIHGDLGTSLRYNQPVIEVLAQRSANTLLLMAIAWVVSGVLGFALGIVAGAKSGSVIDKIIRAYCFVLAATPTFWLGLVALVIFSVNLGWFPLGFSIPIGKTAADVTFLDALHHVTLPALTLSVVSIANVAMHTREKTIDIMQSDYFKFAIARGMSRTQALLRHGLRNIALPAITLQFTSISEIFGGSVLIEQVFSYPGLGQAAVTAGLGGDAPLLVGIAIVSALIVFCGNLTANILYAIIDPRLRPQRKLARSQLNSLGNLSGNSTADAGVEEGCAASDGTPTAAAEFPANALQSKSTGEAAPVTFHAPQIGRVSGRKRALVIAVVCAIVLIAVFVAGALLQTQAMQTDLAIKHLAPSLAHPFGTDQLGRDMLVRTLAGLSTSIGLGLVAALVSSIIALVLGTLAALGPKWIDGLVTFCIDLMLSIPHIVLLILISYALGRGFWGVAVGIALTHWASLSRIVRAEVMQTRRAPFIAHARRLGARPLQIARRHILPAVLPQFIVGVILMFPHAILHEASITFLGFGLSTETPAIGVILSDAMSFLSIGEWWLAVLPGLALLAVVMLFDAIGQSLRTLTTPASTQL